MTSMKATLLAFKGLLAYASGIGVLDILHLSSYVYKCHYLQHSNNIYKLSRNYKYDGSKINIFYFLFALCFMKACREEASS